MRIKIRFLSITAGIVLLTLITFSLLGSLVNDKPVWLSTLASIISNQYISSIIVASGTIFIFLDIQISLAKKGIKSDFRCQEILSDDISKFKELFLNNPIPRRNSDENETDFSIRENKYYKTFLEKNKSQVRFLSEELSHEGNLLLIDTLKISMFYNLNFKLISIINNILNRMPNFTKYNIEVREFLNNNRQNISEHNACIFMIDLLYLVKYWEDLFNYLKFDAIYSEVLIDFYKKYFPSNEYVGIERMTTNMYMCIKTFKKEIKKEVKARKNKKTTNF